MSPDFIPAASVIIGEAERAAVDRVLTSGMVAQGPEVAAFESEFADLVTGGRTCVAVSSGTAGLHLGLLAAGIGPGDEVIVPSFTFAATANSVALTGATPVFADIEPTHFGLDAADVRARITERTTAIMPVHLYGHPADLDALGTLAAERGLMLFEDAAQAHAATWQGRPVGTFGAFAMFSLYPTKNMTSAEGGMVACESAGIARNVRLLRNQGMEQRYANEIVGFNARMTDLHAALGRVQLGRLLEWTGQRKRNAAFLSTHLEGVVIPQEAPEAGHVYHQYTIRVPASERDRLATALHDEHGVGTGVYYPIPNHRLASLKGYAPGLELPETERAAAEVLSLPVHPSLGAGDLERIAIGVNTVMRAGA